MTLPPGQRAVDGFPRFGTHFHRPPPPIPDEPTIELSGSPLTAAFSVDLNELSSLPRLELTADFHCVAGWSATGLRWERVPFERFYRLRIEPVLKPGASVSHLSFDGLDGYRSIVSIEDALGDDVLLAQRLNDEPLDSAHGAPVRLVSPSQYGFISTKHLCRIELHSKRPPAKYHRSPQILLGLRLVEPHPRARVSNEERHRYLPSWPLRPIYRRLIGPIAFLSARGDRPAD